MISTAGDNNDGLFDVAEVLLKSDMDNNEESSISALMSPCVYHHTNGRDGAEKKDVYIELDKDSA